MLSSSVLGYRGGFAYPPPQTALRTFLIVPLTIRTSSLHRSLRTRGCPPVSREDPTQLQRTGEGGVQRVHHISVVRVQPWTSRSITDLLSTLGYAHLAACPDPLRSKNTVLSSRKFNYAPERVSPKHPRSTYARGCGLLGGKDLARMKGSSPAMGLLSWGLNSANLRTNK
jgi:hypothetical protein